MPGPDPISPLGRAKADEDHDLPTTSRMQSLLMEQEARIKLHFDQAIEKLLVSQVGILDPVVRTPSQRSQSQTPRRRNQNVQNNQYKAGAVPNLCAQNGRRYRQEQCWPWKFQLAVWQLSQQLVIGTAAFAPTKDLARI